MITALEATAIAMLLAAPALAENKKVVLSQAFQSMLYLPLYVAIDEGFFTQQGLDLTKDITVINAYFAVARAFDDEIEGRWRAL